MATSTTDGAIIQFMFMERQNCLTILFFIILGGFVLISSTYVIIQ